MSDVSIYKYISNSPEVREYHAPIEQSTYSSGDYEFVDIQPQQNFSSPEKQFKYSRYEQFKSRIQSLSPSEKREYETLKLEFEQEQPKSEPVQTKKVTGKSLVVDHSKFVESVEYQEQVFNLLNLERLKLKEQQLNDKLNSKEYLDLLEKYFELLETQSEIPQKDKLRIKRVLHEKKELRDLKSKIEEIEQHTAESEVCWTDTLTANKSILQTHSNVPIRAPYSGGGGDSRMSFKTSKKE